VLFAVRRTDAELLGLLDLAIIRHLAPTADDHGFAAGTDKRHLGAGDRLVFRLVARLKFQPARSAIQRPIAVGTTHKLPPGAPLVFLASSRSNYQTLRLSHLKRLSFDLRIGALQILFAPLPSRQFRQAGTSRSPLILGGPSAATLRAAKFVRGIRHGCNFGFWRFSERLWVAGAGTPPRNPKLRPEGQVPGRSTGPGHPECGIQSPESKVTPIRHPRTVSARMMNPPGLGSRYSSCHRDVGTSTRTTPPGNLHRTPGFRPDHDIRPRVGPAPWTRGPTRVLLRYDRSPAEAAGITSSSSGRRPSSAS
jgi:hypothetical protein